MNKEYGKLLVKAEFNLTQNVVKSYWGDERLVVAQEGMSYSAALAELAEKAINRDASAKLLHQFDPKMMVMKYGKGTEELSIRYQRRLKTGRALWVENRMKLYQDPDTHDVMALLNVLNVQTEQNLKMMVDRLIDIDYEYMAVINTEERLIHNYRYSDMDESLENSGDIKYGSEIQDFINMFVVKDHQEKAREIFQIAYLQEQLEQEEVYNFICPVSYLGKQMYKKWQFIYLDDGRQDMIVVRTDVTEIVEEEAKQREMLKNALLQAEAANNAKSDFLSRMSHEIRTPMNAIIGMSTLAAQSVNDPKEVADCISKVGISARFLLSLINDILDMSRIENGKVNIKHEKIPFEEFINGINTICIEQANEKGVDYDAILTGFMEDYYMGDSMKLQQVLINLITNAIKFTPAGGKVQFIISPEKSKKNVDYVKFIVNDTGIGISEEFIPKLFEPFEQENVSTTTIYGGTGLGLAICKNLVSLMGGTIGVNSIQGVGSEFSVTVPLEVCEEQKKVRWDMKNIAFQTMKALIVDDEVLICEQTQRILNDMGIRAEWVDSGKKAIQFVKKKWSLKKYYDVIFVDWKMPEMDGIETVREIRKIVGPDVTIIIMTAYDWAEIEKEAIAAGVNLMISKPLFKSSLTSAFYKIYDKKEQEGEQVEKEYDFTGKRVLLVEDHILNIEVAKRLLEAKHVTVEVAENGLAALECFTTAPDNYYDTILMDIRMPLMDGLTAARSIRHLKKAGADSIPILAMSANAFEEDIQKSKAAGMNEHLAKPIEPKVLYEMLNRFLFD